jgi:hypothetical protein
MTQHDAGETRVGVIADTHGLLRPEALAPLHGVALIIHAGDIGGPEILTALGRMAPVVAVRGNNDLGEWANALAATATVEIGGARLFVLHDRKLLDIEPRSAGYAAVIAGHSHQPLLERRNGVLHLNPGAAGPRRFRLPVSVAVLRVHSGGDVDAEVIELQVPAPRRAAQ